MKNKYLIIIGIIIVILIGIIIIFKPNTKNYYKEINFKEFKEQVVNKESFILLVKKDECPYCQSFLPKFKSVLTDYKIIAYSINLSKLSQEEINEFSSIINVKSTPTVVFFKDGEEINTGSRIVGDKDKSVIIEKFEIYGYIK